MNVTAEYHGMNNVDALFDALVSTCRGAAYIIDFRKECFRYVSNHELFLSGHSVDEVMRLGYDFYPRIVHPDDKSLLKKIFLEILKVCRDTEQPNNLHCFSFTVRIRMYPLHRGRHEYLMIYHKLVPIFVDGQVRFGVCLLTCAATEKLYEDADRDSNKDSGNLRLYYKDNERFDEYSFIDDEWESHKTTHLTKEEKIILVSAMNGECNKSNIKELHVFCENLQHIQAKLYKKLGVRTVRQAFIYSINHPLIFNRSDNFDLSESGNRDVNNIAEFEALASICRGSVYVFDFQENCFRYINNHDLFLCGHSADEVKRLGYSFYPEIIHPDDMPLLKKIVRRILKTGRNTKQQNDMHYFSCTVRIRMYPQQGKQPHYLTSYHKMVPIFENGRIRFGVCLLTCSETKTTGNSNRDLGNLRLYYKDNERYDEYSFKNRKWKTYKIEHLTEIEKIILIRAMCGESNTSLAAKLCMSNSKLAHILTELYQKLGVKTMLQALVHSINHSLLFRRSSGDDDVPKSENRKTKKERRNKLTPEVLKHIQTCLDSGQSIRSIAKEVEVSESAIRKAISYKKLTKK
jgi:DNA-binding NarL/FixJ family response regulator